MDRVNKSVEEIMDLGGTYGRVTSMGMTREAKC